MLQLRSLKVGSFIESCTHHAPAVASSDTATSTGFYCLDESLNADPSPTTQGSPAHSVSQECSQLSEKQW
eukprot:6204452-Pleurochrysis_carterae.AAC.1